MVDETAGGPLQPGLPQAMEALTADPPMVHGPDEDDLRPGGLEDLLVPMVELVVEHVGRHGLRVIETGAGLSTMAFLAMGWQVTSVSLGRELERRVSGHLQRLDLDGEGWEYINARSERILPGLLDRSFDVALMDGGRGWPTVWVDFCYLNAVLRPGGLLLIDDTQLFSVRELVEFLRAQPGFRVVRDRSKLRAVLKQSEGRFLPDLHGQPYLRSIPAQPFAGPRRRHVHGGGDG